MEKPWITAPVPRTRRTLLTLVGSVLLHGSIIAVAALWPVHGAPPEDLQITEISAESMPEGPVLPPTAASVPTLLPPEPVEPPDMTADASADVPPPAEELSMEIATPRPVVKNTEGKMRAPHSSLPGNPARSAQAAPGGAVGAGRPGAVGRWHTPQPPYPYAMRAARIAGSGSVRITTDGAGRVTSAGVVQSTGNALLDENTCRFARTDWSGPPNATVTVPITYQMR